MLKEKASGLLRQLLFKLTGREFLVLSPDLSADEVTDNVIFLSRRGESMVNYLPVRYNYHTSWDWEIDYRISGNRSGRLRYVLSTDLGDEVGGFEKEVRLPYKLGLRKDGERVISTTDDQTVFHIQNAVESRNWLFGNFTFTSNDGQTLERRTAHRVVRPPVELIDASYYTGSVYDDYENEAGGVPQEIFSALERFGARRGRFLDIGCATGLVVERAAGIGFDAEGIDTSEWAVARANEITHRKCRVLDFDSAAPEDFEPGYDVIVMHSVIEHLAQPEKALKTIYELCRPGGIAYVQTLNADSLMHRIMKSDWGGFTDHTHKSPWIDSEWLTQTALLLGFEILEVRHYHLWNDNVHDEVWNALNKTFRLSPFRTILEEGLGDAVEIILRRPSKLV